MAGMRWAHILLIIGACWSTGALAQAAAPGGSDTLSLTDAQKADLLNHNTEISVDRARAGLDGDGDAPSRQIHGEFGAMIGTKGTRGAFGTVAIPIGDHAGAVVSFESSRYGRR